MDPWERVGLAHLARDRLFTRQEQIRFTREDSARRRRVVQSRATRLRRHNVDLRSSLFDGRRWRHSVPDELKRMYRNIKERLETFSNSTYIIDRLSEEQDLTNRMEADVRRRSTSSLDQIFDDTGFLPTVHRVAHKSKGYREIDPGNG